MKRGSGDDITHHVHAAQSASMALSFCPHTLFFFINLSVFFFNDTATTEIYTLSLHDALPIWRAYLTRRARWRTCSRTRPRSLRRGRLGPDRKSTRLNSSHGYISYAVFFLKKKKNKQHKKDHTERPHTDHTHGC